MASTLRPTAAPPAVSMSYDDLRRGLHRYLRDSGTIRGVKSQVRATVLHDIRSSIQQAGGSSSHADPSSQAAGVADMLADAIVEQHLRCSGRLNAHSVFIAEADMKEGSAEVDDQLRSALRIDVGAQAQSLLRHLVQRASEWKPTSSSVTVQTGAMAVASLEGKLAEVDANYRAMKAERRASEADRWLSRSRALEDELRAQLRHEFEDREARWREGELAAMRGDEHQKYQALLQAKCAALAETERSLRHRADMESFRTQQVKREVELKSQSLDTDRAELLRLTHQREHALQTASAEVSDLRRQQLESAARIRELEAQLADTNSRWASAKEALGIAQIDVRLLTAEVAAMRQREVALQTQFALTWRGQPLNTAMQTTTYAAETPRAAIAVAPSAGPRYNAEPQAVAPPPPPLPPPSSSAPPPPPLSVPSSPNTAASRVEVDTATPAMRNGAIDTSALNPAPSDVLPTSPLRPVALQGTSEVAPILASVAAAAQETAAPPRADADTEVVEREARHAQDVAAEEARRRDADLAAARAAAQVQEEEEQRQLKAAAAAAAQREADAEAARLAKEQADREGQARREQAARDEEARLAKAAEDARLAVLEQQRRDEEARQAEEARIAQEAADALRRKQEVEEEFRRQRLLATTRTPSPPATGGVLGRGMKRDSDTDDDDKVNIFGNDSEEDF